MKMVDFDYFEHGYNMANKIKPEIAKLKRPQRYLKFKAPTGEIYDLVIDDFTDDEIIVKLKPELYSDFYPECKGCSYATIDPNSMLPYLCRHDNRHAQTRFLLNVGCTRKLNKEGLR